ncbi:hypothetical protein BH23ACT5_BH23ACT5_17140 [soil metagenome]
MIDPIAKLHSPTGALMSVYVNRRPPATRAALIDLLRPLRQNEGKAARVDAAHILEQSARIDTETAPAVAMFASHADGIFEVLPLTDLVAEVAAIGPRPHLRPLRAHPHPLRVGVLIADAALAQTYISTGGGFHEIGEELTTDPGKPNFAGFAGYEEHRTRARAGELSTRLWKQAGRRLLEVHQDQPLDLMVLGGHDEALDGIAGQLHSYLVALPQGRIVVDPRTLTRSDLTAAVATEIQKARTDRSRVQVEQLVSEIDRKRLAVSGLSPVLAACNARAVEQLIVAGQFAKPGVVCDGCGWLARSGIECPVCAATVFQCHDVVAAAMDATVEAGGKVDIASVASRLDATGIGARLRFSFA